MKKLDYILLAALLMTIFTYAAKAEQTVTIKYMNKCADIDPAAPDWTCLDKTQAAQRAETRQQIIEAIRRAKYRKNIKIYSVDPLKPRRGEWHYGAWKRGKYIFFAAMPDCDDAIRDLARLLRKLK